MKIISSLFLGFKDLFSKRILVFLFIIPLGALLFWGLVGVLSWDIFLWLSQWIIGIFSNILGSLQWWKEFISSGSPNSLKAIASVLAVLTLGPFFYVSVLTLTSIFALPVVLNNLQVKFPNFRKMKSLPVAQVLRSSLRLSFLYIIVWFITMPFVFMPYIAIPISVLINSYFNYRMFSFEILSEYATDSENQKIMESAKFRLLAMGFAIALFNIIPLFFYFVPVLSACCFARLIFAELEEMRKGSI